ncbi:MULTISPECIES: hypothetical protein [unclassified Undibacterium]|uniref:hypothetical protein n=1 Tax=unclassified Undibacterium TaxID=2630295 RepID=UPI003C2BD102
MLAISVVLTVMTGTGTSDGQCLSACSAYYAESQAQETQFSCALSVAVNPTARQPVVLQEIEFSHQSDTA